MQLVKLHGYTGDAISGSVAIFSICADRFPNSLLIACANFLLALYIRMYGSRRL